MKVRLWIPKESFSEGTTGTQPIICILNRESVPPRRPCGKVIEWVKGTRAINWKKGMDWQAHFQEVMAPQTNFLYFWWSIEEFPLKKKNVDSVSIKFCCKEITKMWTWNWDQKWWLGCWDYVFLTVLLCQAVK